MENRPLSEPLEGSGDRPFDRTATAFVLFGFAHMLGLMDGELYQLLLLAIALSMILEHATWLAATKFSGLRPAH